MPRDETARPIFVVGNPRTGSTLLSTLLLQHPDVHIHGELFHPVENERRGTHALRNRRKTWFDPDADDAILFLDEHVFGVSTDYLERPVKAVGLKIFADHVSTGGATHLFRRIRAHYPDALILHMRRDDYLDVLISHEFATRSRQWVNWSHDAHERPEMDAFAIPVDSARAFFDRMYVADAYFALHFAGPDYLALHYSELVADTGGRIAEVFTRLNVNVQPVSMVTEKQVSTDDWNLITNLQELQREFQAFRQHRET